VNFNSDEIYYPVFGGWLTKSHEPQNQTSSTQYFQEGNIHLSFRRINKF